MRTVFITGSADGLGLMAARLLIDEGHAVTLHARSEERAEEALRAAPGAAGALHGDLASLAQTRALAESAGRFDGVIHNAAVGFREQRRLTEDGLPHVLQINAVAPYLLTTLMPKPERLVYLSSGMHHGGDPDLTDLHWERRPWSGAQAYSDTKLFDATLGAAFARLWPDVVSSAVEPGWVATKMGGAGAPDDLDQGPTTQAWLAVADDVESGGYWYHRRPAETHPAVRDVAFQDALLEAFAELV
jgi:NAD(P)-dependent dehydrogenase (short-subunit alcohol dehydrogenase family)